MWVSEGRASCITGLRTQLIFLVKLWRLDPIILRSRYPLEEKQVSVKLTSKNFKSTRNLLIAKYKKSPDKFTKMLIISRLESRTTRTGSKILSFSLNRRLMEVIKVDSCQISMKINSNKISRHNLQTMVTSPISTSKNSKLQRTEARKSESSSELWHKTLL